MMENFSLKLHINSKKYGFEVVGRHKDNVYVNNQYYDVLLMDLYLEK